MARINLARRAQIGRDRSARTRAQLLAAARTLYAARPFDQVTVDDVVGAAGVAKGTFYVHFDSLADLQSIVADELAREYDELLQPRRLALDDPIERIAAGCGAFIAQTLRDPAWGALVARSAATMPNVAGVARKRLKEDIDRAARDGHLGGVTPELAFNFATGIMLHMMLSAPQQPRSPQQASAVVAGILRAIGVAPEKAAAAAQRAVAR
jgi:AcrR family transcriptional regulator